MEKLVGSVAFSHSLNSLLLFFPTRISHVHFHNFISFTASSLINFQKSDYHSKFALYNMNITVPKSLPNIDQHSGKLEIITRLFSFHLSFLFNHKGMNRWSRRLIKILRIVGSKLSFQIIHICG